MISGRMDWCLKKLRLLGRMEGLGRILLNISDALGRKCGWVQPRGFALRWNSVADCVHLYSAGKQGGLRLLNLSKHSRAGVGLCRGGVEAPVYVLDPSPVLGIHGQMGSLDNERRVMKLHAAQGRW